MAAPRRFVANASFGRRVGVFVALSIVAVVACTTGLALISETAARFVPFIVLVGVLAYAVVLGKVLTGRKITIDVDGERVVLPDGATFPVASAMLGVWRSPAAAVTSGTVLHLRDGARSYTIGGLDHRAQPEVPLRAPIVETVDAYVNPSEFDALIGMFPLAVATGYRDARPDRIERCALASNPWTMQHGLATILPWAATIVAIFAVVAIAGAFGLMDTPAGQRAFAPVIFAMVIAGITITALRARAKKKPQYELEIDERELRLRHVASGNVSASCALATARIVRGMHRYSSREITLVYPVMHIEMPGREPIAVGVADLRYRWRDEVPWFSAPPYIVGPPDWNTLATALRVKDDVVVSPP